MIQVELYGKIIRLFNIKAIGTKNTPMLKFWLETIGDEYPQTLEIVAFGNLALDIGGDYSVGSEIMFTAQVRGKKVQNEKGERVFIALCVERLHKIQKQNTPKKTDDFDLGSVPF